jgi:hypothetical protein
MTAAGIALIAGGLATLICFRAVLFGPGARRGRRVAREGAEAAPKSRRARGGGRRRTRSVEPVVEDPRGGLAELGLGDKAYESDFPGPVEEPEMPAAVDPEPEHEPEPASEPDRIEGWVRPEYRHVPEEPPSGEYWTPIPVDLDPDPEPSAKGYGWPAPVERLPAAGDYETITGYDVEHEPTEVVAPPPGERRIALPRTWSSRNDKPVREWRTENEPLPGRRRADSTQFFATVNDDPPPAARRRPRPRPRPSGDPVDRNTRVYVSRHAAEPPPR